MNEELASQLQSKLDGKTKPPGSLGDLEPLALRVGMIQGTLEPQLKSPTMLVFAGDHGITKEGVSPYPSEVTAQMVKNFLSGGAAINVFCRQHGFDLKVIDAGVASDFEKHPLLVDEKIAHGTANFLKEKAMSENQAKECISRGEKLAEELPDPSCNVIGFGEMGIGNTSSSALMMHRLTGIKLESCVGRGTGLDDQGLSHKFKVLQEASEIHSGARGAIEVIAAFGGFEIAMMCGAMIASSRMGRILLIDGFIASTALLLAREMDPKVMDHAVFTHVSGEQGHRPLLEHLQVKPLLDLSLRLGEGTGAALAYPLLVSAVAFLNEMASFESAGVSDRSDA